MSVITSGKTFANGEQLSADKLNLMLTGATFSNSAVDLTSTFVDSNGAIVVRDSGITTAKLADDSVTAAKLASDAVTEAITAAYPVGSIYMNAADSGNPATLLGFGTWVAFGSGRVPVGIDAGDTDFDTAEETGGAKTHTLLSSEIPEHTHNLYVTTYQGGDDCAWSNDATDGRVGGNNQNRETRTSSQNNGKGARILGGTAQEVDGTNGQAHNNLQPYIVVYMWKRTA
jgi:hypothetical protein